MSKHNNRVTLLDIEIDNLTVEETLARLDILITKNEPSVVITPNVHHIYLLKNDKEFKNIYLNASLVLADSIPLIWISRLLGNPLKERVTGSDLLPRFCKNAAKKRYKIFFLGAGPGVAKKAAEKLTIKNPGLYIVGTYSPPFGFEDDIDENSKIVNMIKKYRPDILFVGLGPPKQEKWSWNFKNDLGVPVIICIGAGFDFMAGNVKRAPLWMQRSGLEWFFRLLHEPRRLWKRYLFSNIYFSGLVLVELFKTKILRKAK